MSVQEVFDRLNVRFITRKTDTPLRRYRVDTIASHLRIAIAKLRLSGPKTGINLRGNLWTPA
jgi:hypothetical protein